MQKKLYAKGERHLVIINSVDRTLDCYTNDEPGGDYYLRARLENTTEADHWLRQEVLPLYQK